MEKLMQFPPNYVGVLVAITGWTDPRTGEIVQPVTTAEIRESMETETALGAPLGKRAIQNIVTDLETMGLLETWIESRGREGRVKQHETTFEPQLGREIMDNHPNFG